MAVPHPAPHTTIPSKHAPRERMDVKALKKLRSAHLPGPAVRLFLPGLGTGVSPEDEEAAFGSAASGKNGAASSSKGGMSAVSAQTRESGRRGWVAARQLQACACTSRGLRRHGAALALMTTAADATLHAYRTCCGVNMLMRTPFGDPTYCGSTVLVHT
eukprot:364527-Chlamydomonas_euryale.AAC.9